MTPFDGYAEAGEECVIKEVEYADLQLPGVCEDHGTPELPRTSIDENLHDSHWVGTTESSFPERAQAHLYSFTVA
jgi:hypothetical protein